MNKKRRYLAEIGLLLLALALGALPGPLPIEAADGAASQAVQLDLAGHLGGKNGAVFVQGHYAYATFGRELAVLDVTDPARPARVGSALLPGYAGGV